MAEDKTKTGEQKAKTATPPPPTELRLVDDVLARVTEMLALGELNLPPDYSPANALRSAYLVLLQTTDKNDKPVLEVCTRESIFNSLFRMVLDGLSVAKEHGAFIANGAILNWRRMYFGDIAMAKRNGLADVNGNVIYKKDVFEYEIDERGIKRVTKHVQKLENIDPNEIIGAYSTVFMADGLIKSEIMTMPQIEQAWAMSKQSNSANVKFKDQMCIKTAIARQTKMIINPSDDASVMNFVEIEPDSEPQKKAIAANNTKTIAAPVMIPMDNTPLTQEPEPKDDKIQPAF
jgi:recombination protein RecT